MNPNHRLPRLLTSVLCLLLFCATHQRGWSQGTGLAPAGMKNAIFGESFQYGVDVGWSFYPKDNDATIELQNLAVLDQEKTAAEVKWTRANDKAAPLLCTRDPIRVKQKQTYAVEVEAMGRGNIELGVCEYNPNFLRARTMRHQLTEKTGTFTFSCTPSTDATEVRPSVFFNAAPDGDTKTQRCVIFRVAFWVPEAEFEGAIVWPENWKEISTKKEVLAYFGEKFGSYHGIRATERAAIVKEVQVTGILPPYSPIKHTAKGKYALTTSAWDFSRSVLPDRLVVKGMPILTREMELIVERGGSPVPMTPDGDLRVVRESGTEVQLARYCKSSDLKIELRGTLLYDALLLGTVTLQPSKPISVDRALLRITFPAEVARYIRYNTLRGGGSETRPWRFGFGPITAPGEKFEPKYNLLNGRWKNEWRPAVYSQPNAEIWKWSEVDWLPEVWIGDEERGLAWFAESDQGWSYGAGDDTFVLKREGERVVAELRFIAAPIELTEPRTIRFALQATPPKPAHPDWHQLRLSGVTNTFAKRGGVDEAFYRKNTAFASIWHSLWSEGCSTPRVKSPDKLKEFVQGCHASGVAVFPYLAPTHIELHTPEGYYYGKATQEWAKIPYQESVPISVSDKDKITGAVKTCVNSFFADWMAKGVGDLIDQYDIDGIYFDNCTIRECSNTEHGCGWRDADGEVHATIPFMAIRRFFMLVRNEFHKRGKPPLIWCHGAESPAEISFIDFSVLGEGVYGLDHTEQLSLPEMRANFIGPNQSGFVRVFLPQFGYGHEPKEAYREEVTRHLLALTALHGTPAWWIFCNATPFAKMANAMDRLGDGPVEFVPYWKWDVNKSLNPQGVYASMYKGHRGVVIATSNLSEKGVEALLPIAALRAAMSKWSSTTDILDGGKVEVTADGVRLTVKAKDVRVLLFE